MGATTPAWAEKLLRAYDERALDLPWRRTRDPWSVLVAEIMLQQTRVETVLSRYERFLDRFPAPEALAEASEASVLREWEGLGYYRRARALHRAALALRGREFPRRVSELAALPGVGAYTAAAVSAIAFDEPVLPVDANVDRVLSRVLRIDEASPAKRSRAIREAIAPPARAGDFAQALFDLGRTVCLPRAPRCAECVLATACASRRADVAGAIPPMPPRRRTRTVHVAAAVVARGDRVLLVESSGAFLGGLWAPPHAEAKSADAARKRLARLVAVRGPPARSYEALFTHKRWRVSVYEALPGAPAIEGRWHARDALPPIASAWKPALDVRPRAPSSPRRRRSP